MSTEVKVNFCEEACIIEYEHAAIKLEKHARKRKILFLSLVKKWNCRLRNRSKNIPLRTRGRAIMIPPNGGGVGLSMLGASIKALHMKIA